MIEPNFHLNRTFFAEPIEYESIFLLQIGRMFCNSTTVIDSHIHTNLYELTIVTDGKAIISTNDIPTSVKKGDIYLSYPGDIHKIESDKNEPLKYDFFAFRLNDSDFKNDFERIAQDYSLPSTRVFHDDRIRALIGNAIGELDSSYKYRNEVLNSVFRQIMIYVIRGFENIKPSKNRTNATRSELLCHRLMNYIDTHVYSMKTLTELANVMGYSYGYLSTLFKKTTGESLSAYYHNKRLELARLLILENRLSITEIAETLGYASLYVFSRAFTARYGVSPRRYRSSGMN